MENSSSTEDLEILIDTADLDSVLNRRLPLEYGLVARDAWGDLSSLVVDDFELRCVLRRSDTNDIVQIETVRVVSQDIYDCLSLVFSTINEGRIFLQDPVGSYSKIAVISGSLSNADAMSNHAIRLVRLWKAQGGCADHIVLSDSYDISLYGKRTGDIDDWSEYACIVIEYGCFMGGIEDIIKTIESSNIVIYFHGITPPKESIVFDAPTAFSCKRGLDQLKRVIAIWNKGNNNIYWLANSKSSGCQLQELVDEVVQEADSVDNLALANSGPIVIDYDVVEPLYEVLNMLSYREADRLKSLELSIACVGRMVPHKRCEDVILLAEALGRAGFLVRLDFVYGSASLDYEDYIKKLALDRIANDSCAFYKKAPEATLARILSSADLCVLPSVHEGYGIVVRESLLVGTPVLSRRLPSVSTDAFESVFYSDFSESELDAFSELIKEIVGSDSLRKELERRIISDGAMIRRKVESARAEWVKHIQHYTSHRLQDKASGYKF